MRVDKNKPVSLAEQEDDSVFPIPNALLVAGTLGSVAFFGSLIVFSGNPIVSFYVGLIGASLGLGAFSFITGHRVHSVVAAIMGAILAPALSATLMVVCVLMFDPVTFSRDATSHGPTFASQFFWLVIYFFIIFPVSLIVGTIVGYRFNRRLSES